MTKEKPLKCPDFSDEVNVLIQDFVYSKEDIEFSFVEDNLAQANLFSLYVQNKCITAVLMDQHEKEFMYLGYMSTLSKWRRKGIGKTMMKLIIRLCYIMSKEIKDIYLISRNIQDENGKWYTVKNSPVYRFWESLGFVRIPWGRFPSIPTVLEQGTILTQARAYRFEMNEANYNGYIKEQSLEQLIAQLRSQTNSEEVHLKVFSPNLHPESMTWLPLPKSIAEKEEALSKRFHRAAVPQMPPSYFAQHRANPMQSMTPVQMQQEMAFNNMMLQSMYMNQMMIMQQNMVAARMRFARQHHAMQLQQANVSGANSIIPANAAVENQNSNTTPAKRKQEENTDTETKRHKTS